MIICECQRALYGMKCVLRIFWQTWLHILKNPTHCKHVPCNTLTHSTNEDLLNIKRKGDPKSRTLSRTSDTTETRNPCVLKVILLSCSTYIYIAIFKCYWISFDILTRKNISVRKLTFEISQETRVRLNETRFDHKKVVPDIFRSKKSRHYFDALDKREIGR